MIKLSENLNLLMRELKDTNAETYFHSLKVKKLVSEMIHVTNRRGISNYSKEEIDAICKGALLHDLGKLYVRNFILTKESFLSPDEKVAIQDHINKSLDAVKGELEPDEYEIITNICLYHHERIDGSGYVGKTDLPIYVQIVSICDVFDALFSDRVYREGYDREKVISMIENGDCGKFSDEMIACIKEVSKSMSKDNSVNAG